MVCYGTFLYRCLDRPILIFFILVIVSTNISTPELGNFALQSSPLIIWIDLNISPRVGELWCVLTLFYSGRWIDQYIYPRVGELCVAVISLNIPTYGSTNISTPELGNHGLPRSSLYCYRDRPTYLPQGWGTLFVLIF